MFKVMESYETTIPLLYDRLKNRYMSEKHQSYDLTIESAKINMILRPGNGASDDDKIKVAETICKLIYRHVQIEEGGCDPNGPIPYGGKKIAGTKCPSWEMRKIPPTLQQILIRFINEVSG